MSKRTILKPFIAGLAAGAVGFVLITASALAWAAHLEVLGSANTRGWLPDDYSQTMLILVLVGAVFATMFLVSELTAWTGAVVNAHRLADKRWFNVLFWCGAAALLGVLLVAVGAFVGGTALIVTGSAFGVGVCIVGTAVLAYLVGAPDAVAADAAVGGAVSARSLVVIPKSWIASWFGWGWIAIAVGGLLALVVSSLTDPGRLLNGQTWVALALIMTCSVIAGAGALAEFASWWAGLFNAHRLSDKTWFNVLLWSGVAATALMPLFGLGSLIVLGVGSAYVKAAPDTSSVRQPDTSHSTLPGGLAAA